MFACGQSHYTSVYGIVNDIPLSRSIANDMPNGDSAAEFWNSVRQALRDKIEVSRQAGRGSKDYMCQQDLARALGLSPQRFANFLAAKGDESINGFALARACALGVVFSFGSHRVGRIETLPRAYESSSEQLVLEFTGSFEIEQTSEPLTISLRRPATSERNEVTFRFRKSEAG